MLGAYILIQAEIGAAARIAGQVAAVPGVIATVGVTGPYDVIARAEAPNAEDLGNLVVARIQRIEGITHTLTCPIVHHQSPD
ncbi:MAG TPA: Lrp/AsnC ligand binding domain-containing protein [Streptosporangiaceae bacterium]|nr:Lrp/AsnC ligand binding domain-containing protein [Streptosporangiaceae bacterium]